MTVNDRNCCILLYKFLKNELDIEDISEKVIICGVHAYLLNQSIKEKKKNNISLNLEEKLFLNCLYYDNEMLFILLDLQIRKLINEFKCRNNHFRVRDLYYLDIIYDLVNIEDNLDCKKVKIKR